MNKNQNRGFLQIIIFVIVALVIMKFLGVTVTQVFAWLRSLFASVL